MSSLEVKAMALKALDEHGRGSALFALWSPRSDSDNDITEKGFFGDGIQEVFLLPHHVWNSTQPPLGKGVIYERAAGAVYDFQLNLDLEQARNWHSHFKFDLREGKQPRQQWSYGFRVKEGGSSPRTDGQRGRILHAIKDTGEPGAVVIEVSPVTAGSQSLSRTMGAKAHGDIGPGHPDYARIQRWHRKSMLWAKIEDMKVQIAAQAAHERWMELQREIEQHVL